MAEVFVNITGYSNYQVSNCGNVKNIRTGRVLKSQDGRNGYLQVNLSNDGEKSTKKIHKLVANAFLENPENKRCIDHIDHNRTNNRISNLRYATNSENSQNKSMQSNNTSGIVGISFHKASQKWTAQIFVNGLKKHLGSFDDKNDAITARQEAEMTYFGEYRAQTI